MSDAAVHEVCNTVMGIVFVAIGVGFFLLLNGAFDKD